MTTPQSPAMVEVDRLPELKGSPFESSMAQTLHAAFIDGWGACRDAEFSGSEAMNDAFNQSATLGLCLSIDQSPRADILTALLAERAEVVRLSAECEKLRAAIGDEKTAFYAGYGAAHDDINNSRAPVIQIAWDRRAALATPTQGETS